MAQRWKVPDELRPYARAAIEGVLEEQPKLQKIPGDGKQVAKGVIQVGAEDFAVVACGDQAKTLSECFSGTYLQITGTLKHRKWKTGEGKPRELYEIKVESIAPKGRATEKWNPST